MIASPVDVDAATTLTGLWPWIAGSLAGLAGFELLRYWLTKAVRGVHHRWVARRALRGEAHAERLLARAGYDVIGRQVERGYVVRIDGLATKVVVRADLLVQDPRGQVLVAEVKTGREAPRIENSATRRQLLEYRVAFDAPGVLLVDADTETINEVRFPAMTEPAEGKPLVAWPRALLIGAVLGFVGALSVAAALGRLDLGLP